MICSSVSLQVPCMASQCWRHCCCQILSRLLCSKLQRCWNQKNRKWHGFELWFHSCQCLHTITIYSHYALGNLIGDPVLPLLDYSKSLDLTFSVLRWSWTLSSMCTVTQPGAIWQQRQKDIRPSHWKQWYGSAETRAKTTETCGVPGLPFVFVAKIAGLRVGHCNVSGLLAHPIVGCKRSMFYFNVICSWLVCFNVVLGIFNLVLFSWMGKKSSRVEWQARWNMRFPAGTCGTVLWKASIVIQPYPTEICGSCCKAFHCVARA